MIPEGWQARRIDDIATVSSGGTPSRKKPEYWNGHIPWITTSSIDFNTIYTAEEYITEQGLENSSARLFPPGTVLMAMYGQGVTRAKVAMLGIEAATNQACASISVGHEVQVSYLFYYLAHRYLELRELAHGSNQSNLSGQLIKGFRVLLPPLPEQRKIAAILSTWDEAIALTERLIAALQQRKQGLMQRLLTGQVRFPGFEDAWRKVRLGEVAELIAGGTPSTRVPEYWDGDIRWMKSGEVHLKRIYEVENRITQAGLDNSSAAMLPVNSVLVALAGQGKTRGTVAVNKVKLSTNQSVAAIVPDAEELFYEYLFYNLDSRYHELRRLSTGDGGRGGLNLGIIGFIKVPLPPVDEQERISEVLRECDTEIVLLTDYTDYLREQKKGLMQRLLTGQIRVAVDEPASNPGVE